MTDDARTARIRREAREILERAAREDTPEERARTAARREQIRKAEADAMIDRAVAKAKTEREAREAVAAAVDAPAPGDLNKERFVSLERAAELCDFAWRTVKFSSGKPDWGVGGNCVGKAKWLQRHLGGIVIEGYRKDREKTGRHAALLFASGGAMFVADYGEIIPIAEYPFYVCGFNVTDKSTT